jgi:hypothetical protein
VNGLRWVLGITTGVLLVGWILLEVVAGGFRRSFGASPTAPLVTIGPASVMVLILTSVIWPHHRGLLHLTAAVVALCVLASFWIMRESPGTGFMAILYMGTWLVYYWLALKVGKA